MSRQLRPRKSKPTYDTSALAFGGEGGDGQPAAGPSRKALALDEGDSGSDFSPEKDAGESRVDPEEDEMSLDASGDDEPFELDDGLTLADDSIALSAAKPLAASKAAGSSKPKAKINTKAKKIVSDVVMPSLGSGAGIARTSKRQIYVLPTPSVHHRHRAVPLYTRAGRVERLAVKPVLFGPLATTPTNNFTHNLTVINRVNKGWGFNVGSGPLWDLVEDRGWYKEALVTHGDVQIEANRRPITHRAVRVKPGWAILSPDEATPYLPTDTVTTDEGNLKPPPPIACLFGPHDNQKRVAIGIFESRKNSDFIPESKSHLFNPGAPVWGLDWWRFYKQYLAVAPFPTVSHSPEIGVKVARPSLACIQIWSLSSSQSGGTNKTDAGVMRCEMVLCIDSGPAHDLKWCPLPSHDSVADTLTLPRKLGLLAGTFEDGSFSIYVVPDLKIPEPLLRIELEETSCWSFDWANSELVAIGTTHGTIAVYHLGQALRECSGLNPSLPTNILPSHYLTVHQSAIRALTWVRAPPSWPSGTPRVDADPTVIVSGGYDGLECLTDIREGHGSVMNRTRDVINTMTYSPFGGGPITIDHENIVKIYSVSPSMLGRGHILMEPQGPVWSLTSSDYHPQLAVGSADGVCSTTNTLRSTRRGGSVPFFVHKIYQLDYSRNSKEFRMLERFVPTETQDRPTQTRVQKADKAKNKDAPSLAPGGTGAWSREVGVQRVVWNNGNGLGASSLLASATGCGLCRVDVLWGRWLNDRIPYSSVAHLRMEVESVQGDAMDVDSDDSD
ncbi:hypothetical protein B0H10DRAFT_2020767 [Mycena sp. CBHHK59/15]|nr:hypothetical protein B0H10DRAFT_2020767 [Mycena sp. CBHHK59/15]